MSETVLVAGPWMGEFGYELFRWQGHIRALAHDYDRVVVASRPGHEVLYKDFAEFIPVDSDPNSCDGRFGAKNIDPMAMIHNTFGHIPFYRCIPPMDPFTDDQPAEYVVLGQDMPSVGYEIVFHARHIQAGEELMSPGHAQQKMNRNWPEDKWLELVSWFNDFGYEMACIGHPDCSLKLPYCDDRRGLPLDELAGLLAHSGWIMGPSSGPMHFASLCKCQQFVWGAPHLHTRYEQAWNPFNTFVHLLDVDEDFNPDVEEIKLQFTKLHE